MRLGGEPAELCQEWGVGLPAPALLLWSSAPRPSPRERQLGPGKTQAGEAGGLVLVTAGQ